MKTSSRVIPTIFSVSLGVAAALVAGGCSSSTGDEASGATESALTGSLTIDVSCGVPDSPNERNIRTAVAYARIMAGSTPFKECVDQAMRGVVSVAGSNSFLATVGPYLTCTNDAIPTATIDQQIARVKDKMLSPNALSISCADLGAGVDGKVADGITTDIGSATENITLGNRTAYYTPIEVAGIVLHENMHLHQYFHGPEHNFSATACGRPDDGDVQWIQHHTVPWIMNACVAEIAQQSSTVCGGIESCGAGQLHVVQHLYDRTYCYCASDPLADPPTSGGGGGSGGPKCKGKTCYTTG